MKIYKDNYGFDIVIDCGTNLTGATNLKIHAKAPSGATKIWAATLNGTTAMQYTVQSGDIDEAGEWILQPAATIGSWNGRGSSVLLVVHDHFE